MARLLGKARVTQLPEKAQMAQLPNEAQVAWLAADRTMKASENKKFKFKCISSNIYIRCRYKQRLREVGACKYSVQVGCVSDVLYTSSLSMQ